MDSAVDVEPFGRQVSRSRFHARLRIIAVHDSRVSRSKKNTPGLRGRREDKKAIVSLCPMQLLGSVVFVQPNFLRMVKLDGKINETRSRKASEPQQQDVDISRPFPKLFIHIKL